MNIRKIVGYVIMVLGIAPLIVYFAFPKISDKLPYLSSLKPGLIIGACLLIIAIGFLLAKNKSPSTSGQEDEEVPIYKGNKIVGYRKK